MTTIGRVFPTRKPLVPLTILDGRGHRHPLQFILDTGFTGELVLPEQYVRRFGLIMDGEADGRPATGEFIRIPTGDATFIWQEQPRNVKILQMNSQPLLGMEFLWNHRISIAAVANGPVTITPIGG